MSTVCVAEKLEVLAPEIFVHGPVALGALCHWYVNPEVNVAFTMLKLKGTEGQTGFTLEDVVPAFGVPVHAEPEIKLTDPINPRLLIPLVRVPPKPMSVPVIKLQPPPVKV